MSEALLPVVHVVDDDEAIRDGLAFLLDSRKVPYRVWHDAESFLLDYRESMRGCVLLDVRMGAMTGPECFELLKTRGCSMPVIFLTGHGDVPMAVEAMRAGALHFIEKPPRQDVLLNAISEAMALDMQLQTQFAAERMLAERLAQLSAREQEVMGLILEGRLNKQIADDLQISMRTVEVHRSNIFDKMGVRSAVELAGLLGRSAPRE